MCGALEECFQRRVSVVVSHLVTGVWRTVQDKKMMSMDTMEMEMDMDAGPSVPFKPQTRCVASLSLFSPLFFPPVDVW